MNKKAQQSNRIQPHWWRKTVIGLFATLLLTYGIVALFAWFGPGGLEDDIKVQFNMWMITPIWLTLFSLSYLFISWRSAALTLGLANLVCWGLFGILRFGMQ